MIEKINENISEKEILTEIDKIFLTVRPYCGLPHFSDSENEILYTVLEEYSFNSIFKPATVFGMPSLMVLKNQIHTKRRPLADIIKDINKLIDFLNLVLDLT